MTRHRPSGFTLIEVLVALSIVAIALLSAQRAVGQSAQGAAALRQHALARWVAADRLALLRALDAFPEVGESRGESTQAGQRFAWCQVIRPTPNPMFRRVELQVFDAGERPLHSTTALAVRPLR